MPTGSKRQRAQSAGASRSNGSEDRRQVILATAARLFRERGYSGTTVRDLAKEVGLTSGSIFHHFGSKEEVLLCVVEEGLRQATERIDSGSGESDGPRDRVRAMIEAHLEALHDGSPEATSVLFHERWALSDEALREMVRLRDGYEALWDDALSRLGGRFEDARRRRLTRLLLFGSMNWTAQWYRPDGDFSLSDIAEELLELYID
jgi:AcrR family transcriptional regulator